MDIFIIGANGQLGTDLVQEARSRKWMVHPLVHADIRIEDPESVYSALPEGAEAIVNTAAFHNVEACEEEPKRAFEVNALGPLYLARCAEARKARLVQISTDYVFGGEQAEPYRENDAPGPVNVYGGSKLAGEFTALASSERTLVVRTCGLFGEAPCRAKGGANFVQLMLRLGRERGQVRVVNDQFVSPTYTRPLATQICDLVEHGGLTGIVHATSEGACTWYEFAKAIFEEVGLDVEVTPVPSSEFPSPVRRPPYSILENGRLAAEGINCMPHWREALVAYLRDLGE